MSRPTGPPRSHSPMTVGLSILRARDALERLDFMYERAHGYAYDSKDRPTNEQDEPVSSSGRSDPTPSIAVDQMVARRILGATAAKVQGIEKQVAKTEESLEQVFREPFQCALCGTTYRKKCKDNTDHEEDLKPLAHYKTPDQQETNAKKESDEQLRKRRIAGLLARLQVEEISAEKRLKRVREQQATLTKELVELG